MIRTMLAAAAVTAVNALNRNSAQSEATAANYFDALTNAINNVAGFMYDGFTYDGDLDFATNNANATTIGGRLGTGVNGTVSGLKAAFGALQLSKSNFNAGSATTTFFLYAANDPIGPSDFTVTHGDGIAIFENGNFLGGFVGPNTVRTTFVSGFAGGEFDLLYVATNTDPPILNVDAAPVPAAFPLLAAGLGGLALIRRRRLAA